MCPGPSQRATLTAPTQFTALELPTNRPSVAQQVSCHFHGLPVAGLDRCIDASLQPRLIRRVPAC